MARYRGPNGAHFAADEPHPRWLLQGLADGTIALLEDQTDPPNRPVRASRPLPRPPLFGAGSGREAWRLYARSLGVAAAAADSRDEIASLVAAAPDFRRPANA